jgi:hypothetical protein
MKELIAFLLPPAIALSGTRILRLLLGKEFDSRFGAGLKFAVGLGVGMLVFTQAALLGALAGINLAGPLACLGLVWGLVEIFLLAPKTVAALKQFRFEPGYLWLLLLLPVLYSWWVFGRLSTLEGTLEFDANAFWVFKSKVLYLDQGRDLLYWLHQTSLAYAHWDYPMLVPCLYLLNYGAVGGVDEFVNKVWAFWMVVALSVGILSLGRTWQRPHPLPILTVVVLCFLPASLHFLRQEGGTIPLLFFVSLTAMLLVKTISLADEWYLAAGMLTAVGAAMTKFEGLIHLAAWFCVLLPICWWRAWLKKPVLWRSALACVICLLPYAWFRLDKPVQHPESAWWRDGLATPGATFHRFPQAWFLNIGGRFFNSGWFHWQPDKNDHLQWIGHWTGVDSLANEQLAVLPWLVLILLALALWRKRNRLALICLSGVILGVFTFLALAICCLPFMQSDLARLIDFSSSDEVGRYSFPFVTAWFLGIMVAWFDSLPPAAKAPQPLGGNAVSEQPPRRPARGDARPAKGKK